MKKILAILTLIICVSTVQAQSADIDSKLLVKYSPKELKKLKKNQPDEYAFAKYCVNNAFYIASSSKEKVAKNSSEYSEIVIDDISNINFYELKIELKQNQFQKFVIKGANKLLIVRSKEFILKELKQK